MGSRVLVWQPPTKVVLSWHLDGNWEYNPDATRASRVEVSFFEEGPGQTRVELVHKDLHRHGEGWERVRDGVDSPTGWADLLKGYATEV